LVTVEHSHTGRFELGPGDADILIQIQGGDVMWQKERLLNVARTHLPAECDFVAWIDCDVIFERKDWPEAAIRELGRVPICQLYRTVYHLRPLAKLDPPARVDAMLEHTSIGYALAKGWPTHVGSVTDGAPNTFKRGHAWCGRREVLDKHGIYDGGY
jgi:hypothetical protein